MRLALAFLLLMKPVPARRASSSASTRSAIASNSRVPICPMPSIIPLPPTSSTPRARCASFSPTTRRLVCWWRRRESH